MGASEIMPNKHIRVYELAKELNKTSKEIMAVLAEKNIEVTTHMATLEDNQAELVRGAVGSEQQEAKKEGAAPAKKKKFVVVHNPENSRDKKSPERRPQTQKSAAKPAARPAAAKPAAASAGTTASAGTAAAPAASTTAPKREGAAAPAARPARPAADRPANGERRSYGDRPQGNRDGQGRGDRPGYNRGDRPQNGGRDSRGGQGAKTAALLLADVAFKTGKYVQGFPEYGPERMGAPITAYNRISDEVIRVHSNIYTPGLVVVVDETLLHSVDVTAGLKEDGAIIVNTPKSADEIKPMLNGYKGKVYTVDARKISVQALGKYFPNSPMLAAAVAVSGVMKKDAFISEMRASYQHKFAKKPEVIDGNMQALELTYEELKDVL